MLPVDVLRQIRRLQLRAKRAVQTLAGGVYHSAFKGAGLAFEEVREYQPGDDVRTIDWNVTARMGGAYVKRYVEERELTILLAVDVSGSMRFGTERLTKRAVAAELAALVAFCAVANNDRVGLLAVTDRVERFVAPAKGTRHAVRLLRDVLFFEPEGVATNLTLAFDQLNTVQRRRAIVFLISDFQGLPTYADAFRRSARQHDLIAVRVSDPRERTWPNVGLVPLMDAETGQTCLIDTASASFRDAFTRTLEERQRSLTKLARSSGVDLIDVSTAGGHIDALIRFFRQRDARRR